VEDFTFSDDLSYCQCPAGKRLYRSGGNVTIRNFKAVKFRAPKSACRGCALRAQCLRHPERTEVRQVAYFIGRSAEGKATFTERMKHKIDSVAGRSLYSLRLGIAEPPFANICSALGMRRFSLRGREKVNGQWQLFCLLHNLMKIYRYGTEFT